MIMLTALTAACSQAPPKPDLKVEDVWSRAVAPGQDMGAVYFTVRNDGDGADKLTAVKVSLASNTEVHESKTVNGISSMAPAGPVEIPARGRVELKPGGLHAMMLGLTVPLQPGDRFFVDLNFEKSGTKTVSGTVVAAGERLCWAGSGSFYGLPLHWLRSAGSSLP